MDSLGESKANIRTMCNDPAFQTDVLNCVTGVCTAQELQGMLNVSLMYLAVNIAGFIHMGKELCEMPLQDNRQEYRAVIVVFATLSFFFVILRVASKIIAKNTWGPDDTWAVVTFVC